MLELIGAAALIILLRVADVSLGTIRIILLARGSRWRASAIGFFESLIWVVAFAIVIQDLDEPARMVAYATGYGLGTLVGATVERKLAIGMVVVQIVAPVDTPSSAPVLRELGFGVTELNGEGRDGTVRVVVSVLPRRRLDRVLRTVEEVNPAAFVTTGFVGVANQRRASSVRK